MREIYFCFDTNVFDRLLVESTPVREQVADYYSTGVHQVLVSAVNVLEVVCVENDDRRTALLSLMANLSNGRRPLALSNEILRAQIDAYALRKPSIDITISKEQSGLWIALCLPEQVGDAEVQEANRYRVEQEAKFREMHERARPHFQRLVRTGKAAGITTAGALIRHYKADQKFIESVVRDFTSRSPVAHELLGRESDFLRDLPSWQCFFLANAASVYLRAVQVKGYGHKKNVGYFDNSQAAYLPSCHVFVTDDRPLLSLLRLVTASMAERTRVLSYGDLREIIVRGYDPPHWENFREKRFRFADFGSATLNPESFQSRRPRHSWWMASLIGKFLRFLAA